MPLDPKITEAFTYIIEIAGTSSVWAGTPPGMVEKFALAQRVVEALPLIYNTLERFRQCNLTEENCASLEVANERIHAYARQALALLDADGNASASKPATMNDQLEEMATVIGSERMPFDRADGFRLHYDCDFGWNCGFTLGAHGFVQHVATEGTPAAAVESVYRSFKAAQ